MKNTENSPQETLRIDRRIDQMVSRKKLIKGLLSLKSILAHEGKETKEMLEIYKKYWDGASSDDELRKANLQFQELLKNVGLGVLLVLPFSPVTLPLLNHVAKRFGIDILPNSFKKNKN